MPKTTFDKDKMAQLGVSSGSLITAGGAMRYVAGCVQRERERLARILVRHGFDAIAADVLDTSMDDHVFKFRGPEHDLDEPPCPKGPEVKT